MATLAEPMNSSTRPGRPRVRSRFHVTMALIIGALMVLGFSREVGRYFIHPNAQRPALLAYHSAVFTAWMLTYMVQTLLIPARQWRWHRRLGWFGLALALVMPPLGVATAIVMRRFDLATFPTHNYAHDLCFLSTPFADIIAFTPCAWAGIALRKRPDWHSRLMYLATASIAEAGFGRIPIPGMDTWFFFGNCALFAMAIHHDRRTLGHVHPVNRWGVPLIVLNEAFAMVIWLAHPVWWQRIAQALVNLA